jgi:hypothetical protein
VRFQSRSKGPYEGDGAPSTAPSPFSHQPHVPASQKRKSLPAIGEQTALPADLGADELVRVDLVRHYPAPRSTVLF